MMKSLRSIGRLHPFFAISKIAPEPLKYFASVNTDKHAAPISSKSDATFAGIIFILSSPILGDALLISAITAGLFCSSF